MIDFYGQSDSCDNYGRKWHEPIPESIHCQESVPMVSLETAVRLPGGLVPDPPVYLGSEDCKKRLKWAQSLVGSLTNP